MHNQERIGPSCFLCPTEWVGEGGEAEQVVFHLFHIAVMASVTFCTFFRS